MQLHVYQVLQPVRLSVIKVFIVSLFTEEKVERGNHASLQDVAVIVCVHQEKMMESIAQLALICWWTSNVYKYRGMSFQ